MNKSLKAAAELHENVPPDWYYKSIRRNLLQRWWHTVRFSEVGKLIDPVKGRVLDIGSADGVFTKVIKDKSGAQEVIGIDVLEGSVNWANRHWRRTKGMKFELGNAHALKYRARSFDAVFALEVMEHVSDPKAVLLEMKRVLKKNGYIILLVPAESLLFRIVWFVVSHFWWARIWEDCHVQTFDSKNKLSKHVKKAGFKVEIDSKFWLGMLNVVKARKIT